MVTINAMNDAKFSTRQAAAALGLPFRSVDRALRQLGFEPTVASRGSGKPRRWTLADIVALKVARCWLDRGASWVVARRAAQWIRLVGLQNVEECPVVAMCGGEIRAASPETLMRSASPASAGLPAIDAAAAPTITCDLRACVAQVEYDLMAVRVPEDGEAEQPRLAGQTQGLGDCPRHLAAARGSKSESLRDVARAVLQPDARV
jgi:hypothetical protein